jgi:hypothetical protein
MFENCAMLRCKNAYIPAVTICNLKLGSCAFNLSKRRIVTIVESAFVLYCSDNTPLTLSNSQNLYVTEE